MSRILVTGADGFVGRALLPVLLTAGYDVAGLVRAMPREPLDDRVKWISAGDFAAIDDWQPLVHDADAVVHLAGRAHIGRESDGDGRQAFHRANVTVSERLAAAAVSSGVRRFVFLSSIKAAGERSGKQPFVDGMPEHPEDAYGRSKLEAERTLRRLAAGTGLSLLILRPPLIYGPGVKANFLALLRWVAAGRPLPFSSIDNCRSLLYVGNLVDAIVAALPRAEIEGTYFLADDECLSTPELIRRLAQRLDQPARLFPMPVFMLDLLLAAVGRRSMAERLTGSLRVDGSGFCRAFGWHPPSSVDDGLTETVCGFTRINRAR